MSNNSIICLMGPTASGKTEMAVDLVVNGGFEIINVDSAQIYKTMDIGTAKPDSQTLIKAPHRLIDILDPSDSYSVAQFCKDAKREIADIQQNGNTPILVGGTIMYFNALQKGLAKLPDSDPIIRTQLSDKMKAEGSKKLHQQLSKIDAESGRKIHQNDTQRILRALEVYEISGKSITYLQKISNEKSNLTFRNFALIPKDRQILHKTIANRFDEMIKRGFIEEVERLFNRGDLSADLPAIRSVGYRQIWSYLSNEITKIAMRELAIIATRQLAKRQITWLRSFENVSKISDKSQLLKLINK